MKRTTLVGVGVSLAVLLLLAAWLVGCSEIAFPGGVRTTNTTNLLPAGSGPVSPAEAVAEMVGPSVVNVKVGGVTAGTFGGQQQYEGEGSGVIFSSDGMIVTNNHVVTQDNWPVGEILVTLATGEELDATIIGRDPLTDLAIIKVPRSNLPAARFVEDISQVRIGEYAVAIGSPLGFSNSVTLGVVSGLAREIEVTAAEGGQALIDLIQTDAAISPGSSGGALADAAGRVIGINVAYLPPYATGARDLGFAIPADVVVDVARQLIATGKASHSFLGIAPLTVTSDLQRQFQLDRDSGILIAEVDLGTPAEEAGLQQGDIIISLDGQPMERESDLYKFLRTKKPGDTVSLVYVRNGQEVTAEVTLGERPD